MTQRIVVRHLSGMRQILGTLDIFPDQKLPHVAQGTLQGRLARVELERVEKRYALYREIEG